MDISSPIHSLKEKELVILHQSSLFSILVSFFPPLASTLLPLLSLLCILYQSGSSRSICITSLPFSLWYYFLLCTHYGDLFSTNLFSLYLNIALQIFFIFSTSSLLQPVTIMSSHLVCQCPSLCQVCLLSFYFFVSMSNYNCMYFCIDVVLNILF